jgi:hypothetical protein
LSTWSVVLLGLIALGSLVQTAFLIGLALQGMKLAKRVSEVQQSYSAEIQPLLDDLKRAQHNLADVSERLSAQAERVEDLVSATTERFNETRDVVMPVASRVMAVAAAMRGLQRGFRAYRSYRARRAAS